jgi:neutral trehalase
MTWVGLERYGYLEDAQRLAYRFLYMCVFTGLHEFLLLFLLSVLG